MRATTKIACALLLLVGAATAEEKPKAFEWDCDGYARIFDAALRAKAGKQRLLVGLSGSGT